MKTKIFIFLLICTTGLMVSCEKQNMPEALQVQKPYTYSDQYYKNLRDYKKTKHQLAYGWFADYSQSFSYGQHFMGLPDSLDICSLWGGIPSLKQNDSVTNYNPDAYHEMRFVMEKKGTKMIVPTIVRMQSYSWTELSDEGIKKYGDYLLGMVFNNDLDGMDLDYEPEGDWLQGENFGKLVAYVGQFVGPKSKNPEKLLIIDFYNQIPPASTEPFVNYFVRQSYAASSATTLQSQYNSLSAWCPAEKFIVTENIGDYWQNGGVAFTEADGNKLTTGGAQMYSLEGMARWNPTQGKKGGFGAFYMQRDYNLDPPYRNMRRAIQIVNPSVK